MLHSRRVPKIRSDKGRLMRSRRRLARKMGRLFPSASEQGGALSRRPRFLRPPSYGSQLVYQAEMKVWFSTPSRVRLRFPCPLRSTPASGGRARHGAVCNHEDASFTAGLISHLIPS